MIAKQKQEIVGYIEIDEGESRTQLYETASWYTIHELTPGVYPIFKNVYHGHVDYLCKVPTTITASHFVNRLLHYSSSEDGRNVGKADSYCLSWAGYCLAIDALKGKIMLTGNYAADAHFFESGAKDRHMVQSAGLRKLAA